MLRKRGLLAQQRHSNFTVMPVQRCANPYRRNSGTLGWQGQSGTNQGWNPLSCRDRIADTG